MTPNELDTLRTRLRHAIQVEQVKVPSISKGSGLSVNVLGDFLDGAALDDQQSLQLHSFLHYRDDKEREELAYKDGHDAKYHHRFKRFLSLKLELRREYGLAVELKERFNELHPREQQRHIKHLEERCKAELLIKHRTFIRWHNIMLADGKTYWDWKERISAYQASQSAGRLRPQAPRSRYDDLPPRGPRPHLPWRGPEKA